MIWRRSRLRQRLQHIPGLYTFRIAALVVLGAGLLITGLLWASSRQRINLDAYTTFDSSVSKLGEDINQRVQTYAEILRGGVGLFKASNGVSRSQWHDFISNYDVAKRYPGFAGIGYAKVLTPSEIDDFTEAIRATDMPEFTVFPEGARDTYVVVTYVETPTNFASSFGFDMFSEKNRREALIVARDSGRTSITNKITLVRDKNNPQETSFLMYLPIYKSGMPTSTVAERQAAIDGFVYSSFRMSSFLSAVDGDIDNGDFGVSIYSADKVNEDELLYRTSNADTLAKSPYAVSTTKTINLPGRKWTAVFTTKPSNYISTTDSKRPLLTVLSGFIFSVTLASFLYMLMLSRAKFISRNQQLEVQRAKDDLLSLASHQLRTPATGVKQYIGMVLQGYVGAVDKEQRRMLEKAYESNERQLETINQILYVTKADAGRLKITKSKFDVIEMIEDVLEEQTSSINQRDQKFKLKFHKQGQMINADKQYIRMAIENLISNASKYSYEHSKVHIKTFVENNKLHISVRDEGVGISEEDMPKLFGKFSRIDNDLSVKAGGSGIGLYLSKQIAQLHHGDIIVSSTPNTGSTFTLILPTRR